MGPDLALGKATLGVRRPGRRLRGREGGRRQLGDTLSPPGRRRWVGRSTSSSYSIERVDLNWDSAYASHYRILTSTDGSSFTGGGRRPRSRAPGAGPRAVRSLSAGGYAGLVDNRATPSAGSLVGRRGVIPARTRRRPLRRGRLRRRRQGRRSRRPGCTVRERRRDRPAPPAADRGSRRRATSYASTLKVNAAWRSATIDRNSLGGDQAYQDGTLTQFNTHYEPQTASTSRRHTP